MLNYRQFIKQLLKNILSKKIYIKFRHYYSEYIVNIRFKGLTTEQAFRKIY